MSDVVLPVKAGPMVVVCPEIAVLGSRDRVIYQSMAIANWPGPVFVLGGQNWPGDLHSHQIDYVNAIETLLAEGTITRFACSSDLRDIRDTCRMLGRNRSFLNAANETALSVKVCGGALEGQVAAVISTLEKIGVRTTASVLAVSERELESNGEAGPAKHAEFELQAILGL